MSTLTAIRVQRRRNAVRWIRLLGGVSIDGVPRKVALPRCEGLSDEDFD